MTDIEAPAESRLARCVQVLRGHLADSGDPDLPDDQRLARMTLSATFAEVERDRPDASTMDVAGEVAARLGPSVQTVLAVEVAAAQALAAAPNVLRPAVGPSLRALNEVLSDVA